MDFFTRRSIRRYKTVAIEHEKLDQLLKAALLSPTGKNSRTTEFVVVDDKQLLQKLTDVKAHGGSFVKDSAISIVVMGKKESSPTLYADCSIAAFAIQIKAHELGLGSCWMHVESRKSKDGEDAEKLVKKLLNIPEDYFVLCLIAIGYSDEIKNEYTEENVDFTRVSINNFSNKF